MKSHSSQFSKIAEEAKSRIREVQIDSVKQKLEQNHPFYLIDVREHAEWMSGHFPRAIHLSKGIIERDIERMIPDLNAEIVLYCGGGYRSALAADNLQKMGYTAVYSMAGGFRAWQEKQYPIEQ